MATVHRFENLRRHNAIERRPTADLPVLDPDEGINHASEPWIGLRLVLVWSIGALLGWVILALGAWGLTLGIHWLWESLP
jgi:hypothetical protein